MPWLNMGIVVSITQTDSTACEHAGQGGKDPDPPRAAPLRAACAPTPRMQRADQSKQLVLADDTLHSFLTDRESDTIWLLAPAIRDEMRRSPPMQYVWRHGRRELRWADPRVRLLQPTAASATSLGG